MTHATSISHNAHAPFTGVGVALITLFDEHKKLDTEATAAHAERVVEMGARAVLVGGTTGEPAALTIAERLELVEVVVSRIGGSAVVVAGVAASSTAVACELTRGVAHAGADCVLSPPDATVDVTTHYEAVKEAANNLPVLAYHSPAKYPPGVDVDLLGSLPVAGCKDSSGDAKRLLSEVTKSTRAVYTGSSSLLLLCSALGGAGALSGIANAYPDLAIDAFGGDADAQKRLHLIMDSVNKIPLPANLKQLTSQRFGTSTASRPSVSEAH